MSPTSCSDATPDPFPNFLPHNPVLHMNTKNESHARRRAGAPGSLPYAAEGRDFPRTNANAANAAADVLPSSPFACHTVNGGGGPSLLGRRKPSRTGKPAGGGRPSQQLFWRRGLTIACVAASVASVAAGTWSYWATFHTDDNAFLGWLGMALGFGSLAIHFSDERGVA